MTEQEKRDKITKGLECCSGSVDNRDCDSCPIGFGEGCALKLKRDALALLKAQEQKCRECGEATSKAIQELQMKLKAQEPNEDWISRKRLKDEIQYYIDEAGWGDEANRVLGWCMEFIDNQMAVKWE